MSLRALLGLLLLSGCGKSPSTTASPSAASRVAVAAPAVSAAASAPPAPAQPAPACRALRVEGEARVGAEPLGPGALLDGTEWVSLGKGASLTLKHVDSGREIALSGPALFRPCGRGREQVLLTRGNVRAGSSGMGVRPGAEVWIATPIAVVHYADADFSLALGADTLSLQVRAGHVEVEGSAKPAKTPLHGKDKLTLPLGKPDPVQLLAKCQDVARAAQASASRVASPTATEPFGARAQAHVWARELARTRCAIAEASIGLVADPGASAGLWADAARSEYLWTAIPHVPRPKPPEK